MSKKRFVGQRLRRQSHYDWHLQLLCKQFNKNFDFQQAHKSPSGIIEWLLTCVYISSCCLTGTKSEKLRNLASENVLREIGDLEYFLKIMKKKLGWNLDIRKGIGLHAKQRETEKEKINNDYSAVFSGDFLRIFLNFFEYFLSF